MGWWFALLPAFAGPPPADRVTVDVAGEIVLASDIGRDADLRAHDPLASPFWSERWGASDVRLTDAAAIRLVAAAVGIYEPSAEVVGRRLEAARDSFDSPSAYRTFLSSHRLTEETLTEQLRARALVDRYLARNLQTDPSDSDAWFAEARVHVAALRARLRIRIIPRIGCQDP